MMKIVNRIPNHCENEIWVGDFLLWTYSAPFEEEKKNLVGEAIIQAKDELDIEKNYENWYVEKTGEYDGYAKVVIRFEVYEGDEEFLGEEEVAITKRVMALLEGEEIESFDWMKEIEEV